METEKPGQATASLPSKDIVLNRVLDLPLEKTWAAFSSAEQWMKWWGPKDYTCPSAAMIFEVGGKYLACMRSPKEEDFWSTGVFKEIVPQKKIVMTDSFSDKEGNVIRAQDLGMPGEWPLELLVTITMDEADGVTKFRLRHQGIPGEQYDDCVKGWNETLDKLETVMK